MKKKNNKDEHDDGVSYTDMNVPGLPWYRSPDAKKNKERLQAEQMSKKERRAIVFAGLLRMLPILFIVTASFFVAAILMWLWIR